MLAIAVGVHARKVAGEDPVHPALPEHREPAPV